MKIKTEKDLLLNGIQIIQNIITPKATLPILSNILIESQSLGVRLTSTDLDMGISCVLPVDNIESGAITIPAKRFGDIIRELPGQEVMVTVKKNNLVVIETENCQFKIMGLPREEFPKLPEFKDREVIKIEQAVLQEMLRLTSFAVCFDETKRVLNGVLFHFNNSNLILAATDAKRLAVVERKNCLNNTEKDIRFIVPTKTIQELNRNLKPEGEVSLILNNNQVLFDFGSVVIISRLLEGEFPNYHQIIPPVSENKIKVDREGFLLALKRASLLSTQDYQAVKLEIFKNKSVISKSTPDIGESREEIPIEYQGKEIIAGFNPGYLIDVLKNLTDTNIDFELTDAERPGVIRIDGYTYVVLPMRLG